MKTPLGLKTFNGTSVQVTFITDCWLLLAIELTAFAVWSRCSAAQGPPSALSKGMVPYPPASSLVCVSEVKEVAETFPPSCLLISLGIGHIVLLFLVKAFQASCWQLVHFGKISQEAVLCPFQRFLAGLKLLSIFT